MGRCSGEVQGGGAGRRCKGEKRKGQRVQRKGAEQRCKGARRKEEVQRVGAERCKE